jgi:hypothetical protein
MISEICFHAKICEILYSKILSSKSYVWEIVLRDADVAEQLIPSTFEEETNLLSTENMETLRIHYMANYWQIRKDFLNYLEDFTTQDSLIGSTISTTSKKHESSVSKVSSPRVFSQPTLRSRGFQQSLMPMTSILSI